MITTRNLTILGLVLVTGLSAGAETDGYVSLFDGHSMAGWTGSTNNYEVFEGALRCKKNKGGTLYSVAEYSDFILEFAFKLPPGGNNGIALRYPGTGNPAYDGMCELQVLDNTAPKYAKLDDRQYHGSAYGMVAAAKGALKPVGEWNFQTVEVVGSKIKVVLNGTQILDADLSKVTEFKSNSKHPGKDLSKGHVGLAGHSDPVEFRNLRIKELTGE